jgi:hypothetical protein
MRDCVFAKHIAGTKQSFDPTPCRVGSRLWSPADSDAVDCSGTIRPTVE